MYPEFVAIPDQYLTSDIQQDTGDENSEVKKDASNIKCSIKAENTTTTTIYTPRDDEICVLQTSRRPEDELIDAPCISTTDGTSHGTTLQDRESINQAFSQPTVIHNESLSTQETLQHKLETLKDESQDYYVYLTKNLPSLSDDLYVSEEDDIDEDFEEVQKIISEFPNITSITETINEDIFKGFVEHYRTELKSTPQATSKYEAKTDSVSFQNKRKLSKTADEQKPVKKNNNLKVAENQDNKANQIDPPEKDSTRVTHTSDIDNGIGSYLRNKFDFDNKENLQSEIRQFVCEHVLNVIECRMDATGNKKIFDKLYQLAPVQCQNAITSIFEDADQLEKSLKITNDFTDYFIHKKFDFTNPEILESQISDCLCSHIKKCIANIRQLKCIGMYYVKYIFPKIKQLVPDVYKRAKQNADQRLIAEIKFMSEMVD